MSRTMRYCAHPPCADIGVAHSVPAAARGAGAARGVCRAADSKVWVSEVCFSYIHSMSTEYRKLLDAKAMEISELKKVIAELKEEQQRHTKVPSRMINAHN